MNKTGGTMMKKKYQKPEAFALEKINNFSPKSIKEIDFNEKKLAPVDFCP